MARSIVAAAAALLLVVALAPAAQAGGSPGTTSTGDVDTYNAWSYTDPGRACTQDIHPWQVTFFTFDLDIGDRILVSAQDHGVPTPADAALVTYANPTVTLTVDGGGCAPPVEVVGLTVSGDASYIVSWEAAPMDGS